MANFAKLSVLLVSVTYFTITNAYAIENEEAKKVFEAYTKNQTNISGLAKNIQILYNQDELELIEKAVSAFQTGEKIEDGEAVSGGDKVKNITSLDTYLVKSITYFDSRNWTVWINNEEFDHFSRSSKSKELIILDVKKNTVSFGLQSRGGSIGKKIGELTDKYKNVSLAYPRVIAISDKVKFLMQNDGMAQTLGAATIDLNTTKLPLAIENKSPSQEQQKTQQNIIIVTLPIGYSFSLNTMEATSADKFSEEEEYGDIKFTIKNR